jgi:hypothetical protein
MDLDFIPLQGKMKVNEVTVLQVFLWYSGLALVRQVLYHLSHTPDPFNLFFRQGVVLTLPELDLNSSSPGSLGLQPCTTTPSLCICF